jgi:hypothetical protein
VHFTIQFDIETQVAALIVMAMVGGWAASKNAHVKKLATHFMALAARMLM